MKQRKIITKNVKRVKKLKNIKDVVLLSIIMTGAVIFSFSLLSRTYEGTSLELSGDVLADMIFRETFLPPKDDEGGFEALKERIGNKQGTYSIYIKNLRTGAKYTLDEDRDFYAASLYKLPVAAAALKEVQNKNFSLDDKFEYLPVDFEGGSSTLSGRDFGEEFTLETLLEEMLKNSDNVSVNILVRELSEDKVYTAFAVADAGGFYNENITNTSKIGNILEELYIGNYLNEYYKNYLFDLMSGTAYDDRFSDHLKPGLTFSHKIGSWGTTGSWHDCGIVLSYHAETVVCLMSENVEYDQFLEVAEDTANFVNTLF